MFMTNFDNLEVYIRTFNSFVIVTVILILNELVSFTNFDDLDINNIAYYLEYSLTASVSS